eukprot:CAMPEP_0183478040 /NCGR_PEP_ID=MMETSP0370-20130417/169208_1 /TAXON_ID=268820 /ORGANISM="Peridinium aciculiferum, Strain PAER-2" /LENGTH=44 /DNA_ID= /DNA_START= /DNA_END= /DNA_ORIENTATION=
MTGSADVLAQRREIALDFAARSPPHCQDGIRGEETHEENDQDRV